MPLKKSFFALCFILLSFQVFSDSPNMHYDNSKAKKEKLSRQSVLMEIADQENRKQEYMKQWQEGIYFTYQRLLSSEDITEQELLVILRDLLSVCQYGHSQLEKLTPEFFQTPFCSDVVRKAFERGISKDTIQQIITELE